MFVVSLVGEVAGAESGSEVHVRRDGRRGRGRALGGRALASKESAGRLLPGGVRHGRRRGAPTRHRGAREVRKQEIDFLVTLHVCGAV